MRRVSLSIVSLLAVLMFSAPLAYSADILIPMTASADPVAVAAVEPALQQVNVETTFVNAISDLMDSDVGYQLDEFAAISLVYSPFATEQSDTQIDQPASDIYVGLRFSF